MIEGAFFSLFNFIAKNKAAQWAVGIIAGIIVWFSWLGLHDRKVRKGANAKAVQKAEKVATKELAKLEERADERIEKANEAADAVSGDITSDSLRDDTRRLLFGD